MKRPITAPMCIRVTRASVAWLAIATGSCGLLAQDANAQEGMRPVPRFSGTSIRDQRTSTQKAASTSTLQWRTSREVAPAVVPASALSRQTETQTTATVQQTRFQKPVPVPGDASGLQLPSGLTPEAAPAVDPAAKPLRDFYADPFGDEAVEPEGIQSKDALPQDASPNPSPAMPLPNGNVPPVQNQLRSPALPTPLTLPEEPQEPEEAMQAEEAMEPEETVQPEEPMQPEDPEASEPQAPADDETMDAETAEEGGEPIDAPQQGSSEEANPFDRNRSRDMRDDVSLRRPVEFSCDKFRKSISEATIQTVSLDISPPFRPDVIEVDEFEKLKTKFDEAQEVREWQSIDGRKLGRGRLRDLAYEKVIIETEFGTLEELPINRVSEADLAYLSKNWGLPQECLIEQVAYQERAWQHSKVTWKASNLCHKPLYFEEVNLERYGHDAGPFAQPIISSAHFFANIAVLPYKMGVHAPSECQYTLGYYRPGNCAPWIVPPVPLSLRGGIYQAAAMTGAFWLIP